MSRTLLLTLDAPTQSWMSHAGNKHRVTDRRPTKTALVGLIANAMGRDFADPVDDLAALDYAVRVDRAGRIERDYHTVGDVDGIPGLPGDLLRGIPQEKNPRSARPKSRHLPSKNADPNKPGITVVATPAAAKANAKQISDTYLADAAFTAAFTGDDDVVDAAAAALRNPARPLFLGRKTHAPARPIFRGVTDDDTPVKALTNNLPDGRADEGDWIIWYTASVDDPAGTVIYDQPVTYGEQPKRSLRAERRTTQHNPSSVADTEPADLAEFFTGL